MQLLADLTGLEVERSTNSEMSILGVAFLAGLQQGNIFFVFYLHFQGTELVPIFQVFGKTKKTLLNYVK